MCTVAQRSQTFYETHIAYRLALFTFLGVQTYNLSSKLSTQTHQLHHLASRTPFSYACTCYRKHRH